MFNKKRTGAAGIIIVLIIVLLAGAGVWYFTSYQKTTPSNQSENQATSSSEKSADQDEGSEINTSIAELYQQATEHDSISCIANVSSKEVSQEVSLFIEGDKLREEITAQGQEIVILSPQAGTYYMYYPAQNMASQLSSEEMEKQKAPNPQQISNKISPDQFEIIREETFHGKEVLVLKSIDNPKQVTQIWLWKEHALPLKLSVENDQGTQSVEFSNYQFEDIDDSKFELPENAQIIEMPIN